MLSNEFIHRDRIAKVKTFPKGDFKGKEKGQKCSRWGCTNPAVSSREVGGKSLGACAKHKAEMSKD